MLESLSVIGYLIVSGGMSAVLLLLIWLSDRYEREPVHVVLLATLWGALPSIFFSCVFESVLGAPVSFLAGRTAAKVVGAVLLAPPIEEVAKAVALLLVLLFFKKEFDGVMDGLVYGAAVGIGFSFVEDFAYFVGGLIDSGVGGGGAMFALRNFGFILNHSLFTALTGIGFGLARVHFKNALARFGWPAVGLCCAIAFHMTHNLLGCFQLPGLILALFVHWAGGLGLLCLIPALWALERRMIIQRLTCEVNEGQIPAAALAALPFSGRTGHLPPRARAPLRHALQQLAFHRKQVEDGWAPEATPEVQALRDQIKALCP
jgi:RsiW-degrading membrane proteinase PrsW (M82 family)